MSRAKRRLQSRLPVSGSQQQPLAEQANQLLVNIRQLMDLKQVETAINLLAKLLEVDPANPEGLYLQGALQMQHGTPQQALESLSVAVYRMPDNAKLFGHLAKVHAQLGHHRACISALHRLVELQPTNARGALTLGAAYYLVGSTERGGYWISQGARLEPVAFPNISLKEKKLRLLVLRSAESTEWTLDANKFEPLLREGHNNLSSMLDSESIEIVRVFIDNLDSAPEIIRKLPKVDLIYNAMTDADRCAEALEKADKLCHKLGVPVINAPHAVLKTTREDNYQHFQDNPDVVLPKSVRLDAVQDDCLPYVKKAIAEHGFELPVIVRVSGFQNGRYTHKVDDFEQHDFSEINDLIASEPRTLYVSQFCDVSWRDDRAPEHVIYPKYRAFFVGGELYPTHVRYGYGEWNVHMPQSAPTYKKFPWLYDLARDYLENPLSHFSESQWLSLKEMMSSLELDYVGVDFAVSTAPGKEGKIVVFEANASMRSFLLDSHTFVPEHQAARNVISAAHDVMADKAGIEKWEYKIPKGKSSPGENWLAGDDEVVTVKTEVDGDSFDSGFGEWLWHECYKHYVDARIIYDNGVVERFYTRGSMSGVEALLIATSEWCEKGYQFANAQCEEAVETGVRFA